MKKILACLLFMFLTAVLLFMAAPEALPTNRATLQP